MMPQTQPLATDPATRVNRSVFEAMQKLSTWAPDVRLQVSAEGTGVLVTGLRMAMMNGVFSVSARPNIIQMAMSAEKLAGLGLPWCMQVRGRPAAELLVVAARHGLTERSHVPLMICAPEAVKYSADEAVSVRTVSAAEHRRYVDALEQGLEIPAGLFGDIYGGRVLDTDGVTPYVVEVDGQPVTTGLSIQANGQAGIYNVATVPEFRGRGYGRAVTERMIRDSFAAGASHVFLTSSDMALPLYESIGFETIETWTYFSTPVE